jgi:tetratricopeptide (TPR) repeat protein
MPAARDLPPDLEFLARRQAITISPGNAEFGDRQLTDRAEEALSRIHLARATRNERWRKRSVVLCAILLITLTIPVLIRLLNRDCQPEAEQLVRDGVKLRRVAKLREALARLNRAIALDPRCAEAYDARAAVYLQLDMGEAGWNDVEQLLNLKPAHRQHMLDNVREADAAVRLKQNAPPIVKTVR